MKDERTDDAVHGTDAKLMHILRAEPFRHSEQEFYVFAVRWIPRVFSLRTVIVHSAGQSFQRQHAHTIRRDEGPELLLIKRMILPMYLR